MKGDAKDRGNGGLLGGRSLSCSTIHQEGRGV